MWLLKMAEDVIHHKTQEFEWRKIQRSVVEGGEVYRGYSVDIETPPLPKVPEENFWWEKLGESPIGVGN